MNVMEGLDPVYLNVGLMKPRRGLTPVAGKKKLEWARKPKRPQGWGLFPIAGRVFR